PTPSPFASVVLPTIVTLRRSTPIPMIPETSMPPPLPSAVLLPIVLLVIVTGPSKIPTPPPLPSLAVAVLNTCALLPSTVPQSSVSDPEKFSMPPPALTCGWVYEHRLLRMALFVTDMVVPSLKIPPPDCATLPLTMQFMILMTPGAPDVEKAWTPPPKWAH